MTCPIKGCPAPKATHERWDYLGGRVFAFGRGTIARIPQVSDDGVTNAYFNSPVLANALDAVHALAEIYEMMGGDEARGWDSPEDVVRVAGRVLDAIRGAK